MLFWIRPEQRRTLVVVTTWSLITGALDICWPILVVLGLFSDNPTPYFAAFVVAFIADVLSTRWLSKRTIALATEIVTRFRTLVADRLQTLALPTLEQLPFERVRGALDDATRAISEGVAALTRVLAYLLLVLITPIYVGFTAPKLELPVLLFLFAVLVPIGVALRKLLDAARREEDEEAALAGAFDDLVDGFKETRLNADRRQSLLEEIRERTGGIVSTRAQAADLSGLVTVVVDLSVTLVAGGIVLAAPFVFAATGDRDAAIAGALIIMAMPMIVFTELPGIARLAAAVRALDDAVAHLDRLAETSPAPTPALPQPTFGRRLKVGLSVEGLVYRHPGTELQRGFTVGPVDLEVPAGRITFLTGGNGSGKSTLLKAITGLYPPLAGRVLADGVPLPPLHDCGVFSAVFTDTHLFRRLYGYRDAPAEEVAGLIERVQMSEHVSYRGGAFSTVALSTGQRKRLALAAALVEDRPVLVLDEWAADQDPEFRTWFYTAFLPAERAAGRTILAATHDDLFFHVADRLVRMEDGRIAEPSARAAEPA